VTHGRGLLSNPLAGSEHVPRPSPTDPLAPTGAVSFADLQRSHLNRFWPIQAVISQRPFARLHRPGCHQPTRGRVIAPALLLRSPRSRSARPVRLHLIPAAS
jgi:hypothetical protein